jgi:RNA polymerase sigma-32 factor
MAKKKSPKLLSKTLSKTVTTKTLSKTKTRPKTVRRVEAEIVESDEKSEVLDSSEESLDSNFDLDIIPTKEKSSATGKSIATADPVTLYLNELRKYPVLSREQEMVIAKKFYETKDPQAAQALVTANLRFVVKVAAEYSKFGARMIDLIQEGNIGLMHAVREFNPYKGARLITYAVWWIRGYIQEYLMKQYSMVKIGTTQNQKRLFYQLQKEKANLDALGNQPDIKMIAEKMGIPQDEVEEMSKRMTGRDLSLDAPVDDNTPLSLKDLQRVSTDSPETALAKNEQLSILREKLDELKPLLNPKELFILEERLLADEPLTLQEIGDKFKTTREAVRQMEVRVMNKIKERLESLK